MKNSLITLTLLFLIGTDANSAMGLHSVDEAYLKCSIRYDNTGDQLHYRLCSDKIFKTLDQVIKDNRKNGAFKLSKRWEATNLSLNQHQELCITNSKTTKKNSTILKDAIECRYFYLRSLAYESEILNQL